MVPSSLYPPALHQHPSSSPGESVLSSGWTSLRTWVQGKQNPGDPAASLSSPATLSADGLTNGISIQPSTVAAAGSVPEPWAALLDAIHCHQGRAPASQRCMAVSHTRLPDSGHRLLSGLQQITQAPRNPFLRGKLVSLPLFPTSPCS